MSQIYVDTDGTLVIPQAAAKWDTLPSNSGLATSGVVILVGEADMGPGASEETDLSAATFGPGQYSTVAQKYGSGNLVDAFRNAANPSRDPAVRGAPSQIICIKTNVGTKASVAMSSGYAVLRAKQQGSVGNMLYFSVATNQAEVPAAFSAAYAFVSAGAETQSVAANGGTAVALTLSSVDPAAFVTTNGAALLAQGVTLTGGTLYTPGTGSTATCAVAVAGNVITVTLSGGTWGTTPTVGDTFIIQNTSSITGAANANSGSYVVTASSPSSLTATKLADIAGTGPTAPVIVGAGAAVNAGIANAYTQVVFTNSATAVAGLGKSISFYRTGTGIHFYNTLAAAATASTGTGTFVVSATEASQNILVNRSFDRIAETLKCGSQVALSVGHIGTGTVTISATSLTLQGLASVLLSSFKTVGDIAAWISAQAGWTAVATPNCASLPPTALDEGVFQANQNSQTAAYPARIKKDAYDTVTAIGTSRGVEFVVAPAAGLPSVQANTFLAGGTRGGSTDASIAAALESAGLTKGNFVCTLFSRDATADIADGLTDATSSYTISGVNSNLSAHVSKYSQFKKRRPRQGFASIRTTYAAAKTAAQTLSNFRLAVTFLDTIALGSSGNQTFQPWMLGVIAAGMQAAGFYRPMFNKSIGISGVLQAAGDFSPQSDDQVEDAILAGLLVARSRDQGGFAFVSDQTTYSADTNFVYNSVQAVYVADVIAQTTAQRMEAAFLGQSLADVTAGVALSYFKGVMADLKRLKLIAASDDAVDGYRNAVIQINAPSMLVSAEVKEATGLYFIPIRFLITQVTATAAQ